jgi:hypothetical protein
MIAILIFTITLISINGISAVSENSSDLESDNETQNLGKNSSQISIETDTITTGDLAVIKATLRNSENQPIPNQQLMLRINGKKYYMNTNSEGIAIFQISDLYQGNYRISIFYDGNDYYINSSASSIINVIAIETILTLTTSSPIKKGDVAVVKATLKNNKNQLLTNQDIIINVNNQNYKSKTDSYGVATFFVNNLSTGTYTIQGLYEGTPSFGSSYGNSSITVNADKTTIILNTPTIYQGKKTSIKATLKDSKGRLVTNTKIIVTINKKSYSANTNSKGIANFKISGLKKGKHTVKASFTGSSEYLNSSSVKNQIVKGIADLSIVKIKRLGNSYLVTIKNKGSLSSTKTLIKISFSKKSKIAILKPIKPGKSLIVKIPFYKFNSHKKYKKTIQINYTKRTKESNYNNNKKVFK